MSGLALQPDSCQSRLREHPVIGSARFRKVCATGDEWKEAKGSLGRMKRAVVSRESAQAKRIDSSRD